MKICVKNFIAVAFFLILLQTGLLAQPVELKRDDKIEYSLGISFSKEAVERKAYMRFKVIYDQEALEVTFSQGKFGKSELRLGAEKFENIDKEGNEGLLLTIRPAGKLKQGTYSLSIELIEKSPDLEIENGSLDFKVDNILIVPDEPVPVWKSMIEILAILLLLTISIYIFIVLKRKFTKGIIQVIDSGISTEVILKGKARFALAQEITGFPYDFVLGKKILGYYQGPVVVKIDNNYEVSKNTGEAIGVGSVIYSEETVIINYSGKTISIYYNH